MAENSKTPAKMAEPINSRKNYQPVKGYDDLPVAVQATVSPKEYAWLGRENRNNLTQELTMPDPED